MNPYCKVGVYPPLQAYAHANTGCDENSAFRGSVPSAEPRYDRSATHDTIKHYHHHGGRSRNSGKHRSEEREKRDPSKGLQDKKDKTGEVQSPSSPTSSLNYSVVVVDGSSIKG